MRHSYNIYRWIGEERNGTANFRKPGHNGSLSQPQALTQLLPQPLISAGEHDTSLNDAGQSHNYSLGHRSMPLSIPPFHRSDEISEMQREWHGHGRTSLGKRRRSSSTSAEWRERAPADEVVRNTKDATVIPNNTPGTCKLHILAEESEKQRVLLHKEDDDPERADTESAKPICHGEAHFSSGWEDQTLIDQTEDQHEGDGGSKDEQEIISGFLRKTHNNEQPRDVKGLTRRNPFTTYSDKVKKRARLLFSDEFWDDLGDEVPGKVDQSKDLFKDCQFQTEAELRREMKKKQEACPMNELPVLTHLEPPRGKLWSPRHEMWYLRGRDMRKVTRRGTQY